MYLEAHNIIGCKKPLYQVVCLETVPSIIHVSMLSTEDPN